MILFRISPSELVKPILNREYVSKTLFYDEIVFRQSLFPILWLDQHDDVRWNQVAETLMLTYLTQKQFPNDISSFDEQILLNTCQKRSIFVLQQHWSGFFSRVLCFIAQFGQTLHTPRIGVLQGKKFDKDRGDNDDFLSQGILRYFLPFSICSAYMYHPKMSQLKTIIDEQTNLTHILRSNELHAHSDDENDRILFSSEYWKMDYHHVPIRKWLFDRKKSLVRYNSPIEILTNHSDEHIYARRHVSIGDWIHRNAPDAFPIDHLPRQSNYQLTWKDHVFGSFLRYMFVLFFTSQNAPRIEYSTRILAQYWSSFLIEKNSLKNPFVSLAALYIRRGDKSNEDSFWHKHQHWRNLSYYVKGLVDEEQQRNIVFKSIFVMTDDISVMNSLRDYTNSKSKGIDEGYARKHLRGRNILHNILAPQTCFDPFRRIGFDQFLVSMRFIIDHSVFTVGHTDSNVFRFLREVIYARRQQNKDVQSFTYVRNAPDSF
jgi:hypothetical protein